MKSTKTLLAMLLALVMVFTGCAGTGNSEGTATTGDETASTEAETTATQETAASPEAGAAVKDTITIGHWEEPASLDPQTNGKLSCFIVELQIYDTLITEKDGVITPCLAESYEMIDDTTIRFCLRKDVTFHNGDPMTAEDVLFTMYRATTDAGSASTFSSVDYENCAVVDEYTFDLKLFEPNASIFNTLGTPRGCIVDKSLYEEVGGDEYARNPVGTGAYKFESWTTGTEITLVRNDEYWGDKALTEKVVYKFITESANRLIELETGGCDIIYNVQASEVELLAAEDGMVVLSGPSYAYNTITFNMQDPVLADQKVRDALVYAIDKASIVEALYGENATVANGIIPTTIFGSVEYEPTEYDPEKAKELLAEAGYADGLKLNFVVQPLEELKRITEAVQNMWSAVGVETEVFTSELSAYLSQGNTLQVGIRNGSSSDPSNTLIIYQSSFGDRLNSNNTELDEMLANAKTHWDEDERKAAYAEICDYLWEAHWTIPIAFKYNILATSDKVEGFEFDPLSWEKLAYVVVYE